MAAGGEETEPECGVAELHAAMARAASARAIFATETPNAVGTKSVLILADVEVPTGRRSR
jgi:hypothetical protein